MTSGTARLSPDDWRRRKFIAIDGGGTKTVCLLGDGEGRIAAVCRGGSSNVKSRPWAEIRQELAALIQGVMERSGTAPSELGGVFLGLAGSDRPDDRRRVTEWLRTDCTALIPADVPATVHNDAVTALAAGTWGERGIALISGTGSIAYGFDPASGAFVRVGGWGYLLGDEGSGFDVGRKALVAVMRQFDGRGKPTSLTELALERWSLKESVQLINTIYEQDNVRTAIADFAKLVLQAAAEGDDAAEAIVRETVESLEELVRTADASMREALSGSQNDDEQGRIPLVLTGGLFANEWLLNRFMHTNTIRTGSFEPRRLELPPVVGAYVLALQERGLPITDEVRRRITEYRFD